ncbi:MAG: Nif3-like dinuclear metal center hexameric protein [Sulfurospirillum sp.]|nr:Nif3-like dinuclear metal center hexameric protein [Sulfurospirillum sp.]
MRLREIYDFLDTLSPFSLQEKWDNSGLIVGNFDQEVSALHVSLDIDSQLIEQVANNSLIITHHPLIFQPLSRLDFALYPANILQKMVQKNISLIALHTNFDKTHLNHFVAKEILGFEKIVSEGFVCYSSVTCSFETLVNRIKKALHVDILKTTQTKEFIHTVALTTGSGGDLIGEIKADCFLSGDFKYHQALAAMENGLSLIDIGHYESEQYFAQAIAPHLKNLSLQVIMSNSKNPFQYK